MAKPTPPAPAAAASGDAAGGLRAHPQAFEPSVGAPVVAQIDVPQESPSAVPHDPEEKLATAPKGTAAAGPSPSGSRLGRRVRFASSLPGAC